LRERRNARTRQRIDDTAARLFAERAYETVTVCDVAREAHAAEQTAYNDVRARGQLITGLRRSLAVVVVVVLLSRSVGC
jgi:AcrR family transcriptional regulator